MPLAPEIEFAFGTPTPPPILQAQNAASMGTGATTLKPPNVVGLGSPSVMGTHRGTRIN